MLPDTLPPSFATILRPGVPGALRETIAEIHGAIPQYARYLDGPHAPSVRLVVELSLATFVDKIGAPSASVSRCASVCRRIGRFEAYEGRGLDDLQTAYRIGARVAVRRAKILGRRYQLSTDLLLSYADAVFGYVEELIGYANEGYRQARVELDEGEDGHRRRLLRRIVAGDAPRDELAVIAEPAGWALPDEVTLVALGPEAPAVAELLTDDALVDALDARPYALVPRVVDDERGVLLKPLPPGARIAVGPTVSLAQAPQSLRWAREVLSLAEAGVIEDGAVVLGQDHLVTLWLLAEPLLAEQIVRRQFARLDDLTPVQRGRLLDTLWAWVTARGNANRMAELLNVHPQTVRYRMRLLDRLLGHRLDDPEARFAVEIAMRAGRLRGSPGGS